ncbi:MAG: hypothetical protein H6883_02605 [Rhodobiaceae bacterium]|nr:hypothetical protein [Rhodobiaceae bacterium]MCC0055009.1 hypothetical protein [Rhodobiaceae bacterium]
MAMGFGIAAVITVVLSFFVPLIGIFGTGFAMLLAAIGALAGDKMFATVTSLIGAVSVFMFSPTIWATMAAPDSPSGGKSVFFTIVIVFLALPILAIFLRSSGKFALGKGAE